MTCAHCGAVAELHCPACNACPESHAYWCPVGGDYPDAPGVDLDVSEWGAW
jgi:hypothetical protein